MKSNYKDFLIIGLLVLVLFFQIKEKTTTTINSDYFKTTAEVNVLNKNYKNLELDYKKLELKSNKYEDSISDINFQISQYMLNPNRKQLDSLRAKFNPK